MEYTFDKKALCYNYNSSRNSKKKYIERRINNAIILFISIKKASKKFEAFTRFKQPYAIC